MSLFSQTDSGALPALGAWVARRRRSLGVRKVAGLCRKYLSWYENVSYDLETNGEAFVLETLAAFEPKTLFDVGANVGDWSLAAHQRCPHARIHSFEISKPTYDTLVARTQGVSQIRVHAVGLSDVAETIRIRHYRDLPALTTSSDYPHPFEYEEIDAETSVGEEIAAELGVDRIQLLKIDVEGMEDRVLNGFERMFQHDAVDLVQFEYGRVSIVTGFLLRNFYDFFEARGFRVGKIYPNYVDFRSYDMADENFLGPNYLACRSDRPELIAALSGGGGRSL